MNFYELDNKYATGLYKNFTWNAAANFARIQKEFITEDLCISTLPRLPSGSNVPAMILGSGVSLDEAMPRLKKWKGILFATPSQLNILDRWEITPHYLVVVDPAEDIATLQIKDREIFGSILLTHPLVDPKTMEAWKGPKRYFRLGTKGGQLDEFFKTLYPQIKHEFPQMGSVVNTTCIIADWMGLSPIILAGVDYCFLDGRSRATSYRKRGMYCYEQLPPALQPGCELWQPDELHTTPEMRYYHLLLLGLWKIYKMNLIMLGEKKAITEIPWITYDQFDKGEILHPPARGERHRPDR